MTEASKRGGMYVGPSHADGGIKVRVTTGDMIEVEGKEALVPYETLKIKGVHTFKGDNASVINWILVFGGGKGISQRPKRPHPNDVIVCKRSLADKTVRTWRGTIEQIVSGVNQSGGCRAISSGAESEGQDGLKRYALGGIIQVASKEQRQAYAEARSLFYERILKTGEWGLDALSAIRDNMLREREEILRGDADFLCLPRI